MLAIALYTCLFLCTYCCSLIFRYWRYSEEMKTMDPGYPKPITVWKGIPESPQGAFVHKENGMHCIHHTFMLSTLLKEFPVLLC